ncbi:MAG: Fe-S-containing protein [Clostridiales bacterium]|nr:Fe-S-containing protein [Clostridiales bacterium]
MFKYLILVIQNSFSTAIILAMLFAIIKLTLHIDDEKKWPVFGFVTGSAAALILAFFKHTSALVNREYFNTAILCAAIPAEILFCVLSWGGLSKTTPKLYSKLRNITNSLVVAALLFYCLPDIFLYPTEFVLTGQSAFSTDFLFKAIGYAAGLLVVIITSTALRSASTGLSFKTVRILLTSALAVNILNQMASIIQFLMARRVIPVYKWLFAVIKPIINHNELFLYAIILIASFIPVKLLIKSLRVTEPYSNPAEHRKIRSILYRKRRLSVVVATGYVLALLSLTVVKTYDSREVVLSPAEPMNIVGEEVILPIETINDGHLHRFVYTASEGVEVRFIVIKKNDVSYGVGLDACDICGPTGYYERDGKVICKLCDVVMNVSTIGFKGGCNPVPLTYSISGGNMVIQTGNLEKERNRFK